MIWEGLTDPLTDAEILQAEIEQQSEDRSRMGVIGWMLFSLFITAAVVGVIVA